METSAKEFWLNLQKEQKEWCDRNFGQRKQHQPFLGLVEEWGELLETNEWEKVNDAIADLAIFGCDLASTFGIDASEVVFFVSNETHSYVHEVPVALGKMAHHILKLEQGIRGTPEEHRAAIAKNLGCVFFALRSLCNTRGLSFEKLVDDVWQQVRQRDWKKDSKHAGVGA